MPRTPGLVRPRRRYVVSFVLAVGIAAMALVVAVPHPFLIDAYPYPFATSSVRRALDTTVSVWTYDARGYPTGNGTGVIIDEDVVATCLHVVEEADYLLVRTVDGDEYRVRSVIDSLPADDLVLLRTRFIGRDVAALRSWPLEHYDDVFTLGYSQYTQTNAPDIAWGSMAHAGDDGWFAFSALAFPGFSGGGVFSESGELLGLTTSSDREDPALTYAVTAEHIQALLDRPREKDARRFPPIAEWPYLSIFLGSPTIASLPEMRLVIDALETDVASLDERTAYARIVDDPDDPLAHRSLLLRSLVADEFDLAGMELDVLKAQTPDDPFVVLVDAIASVTQEAFDEALATLEGFEGDAGPLAPHMHLARGLLYLQDEQPARALEMYRALRHDRADLAWDLFTRLYPGAEAAMADSTLDAASALDETTSP